MSSKHNQKEIAEKIYKSILANAKYWISELDYYGKNQFKEKIKGEGWSIGQIYDHIVNGTYAFQLKKLNDCLIRENGSNTGVKTFLGKIIFWYGSFFPFKTKGLPASAYIPDQPENPEKFKDEFYKFLKVVQKAAKEAGEAKLDYKTSHPTLGMLNAMEWLKLIEMHQRHHVMQKKRLDRTLRSEFKYTPGEEVYSDV
jgi:hypothetical protein